MAKPTPKKLAEKLKAIREHLDLTQDQMANALGQDSTSRRARIHEWESGKRQPDLVSLLAYAQLAKVSTDVLIDDAADFKIP